MPVMVLCALVAACGMAEAAAFTWQPVAKLPSARSGHVSGLVRGKVLVAGGTYWPDPDTKVWSGDFFVYDPAADSWTAGPRMPFAISYGAGGAIGNRLYIAGGSDGRRDYRETIICVPYGKSYEWVRGPALPEPRVYASSVVVGSRLFVVGGAPDNKLEGRFYNDGLVLDTARLDEGWRRLRAMPGGGRHLPAVAALGDRIFVFGGYMKQGDQFHNSDDVLVYEISGNRWRRMADAPYAARGWQGLAVQERIFLFGGYVTWPAAMNREESFTDRILRFDPTSGAFTDAGSVPVAAIGMNPLVLPDGRVFIAGGEDTKKHRTDVAAVGRLGQ